jgi:hypothetical protein
MDGPHAFKNHQSDRDGALADGALADGALADGARNDVVPGALLRWAWTRHVEGLRVGFVLSELDGCRVESGSGTAHTAELAPCPVSFTAQAL